MRIFHPLFRLVVSRNMGLILRRAAFAITIFVYLNSICSDNISLISVTLTAFALTTFSLTKFALTTFSLTTFALKTFSLTIVLITRSALTTCVGKASNHPQSGASFKCSTRVGSGQKCKQQTGQKRLARDKHCSSLRTFVKLKTKSFIYLDAGDPLQSKGMKRV